MNHLTGIGSLIYLGIMIAAPFIWPMGCQTSADKDQVSEVEQ